MTILLVDSDKKALDREATRLANHQSLAMVILHSNANDAVRFAMYHDVDAVFTRTILTEMTGQELIDKIHHFKPKTKCQILLKDEKLPLFLCQDERGYRPYTDRNAGLSDKGYCAEKSIQKSSSRLMIPPQAEREKGGNLMTEQELRSLGRKELLEILIEQGKELEFLKSEYEKERAFLKDEHEREKNRLEKELDEAKKALQNREIAINEAGSIAVAALQVNGIFEAAQAASQQYIENIRSLNDRQVSICAKRDAESRAELDRRRKETTAQCEALETACREKCETMEAEAKQKSEAYWSEVSKRLQSFYDNHQELKKLLNLGGPGIPTL